MIIYNPTSTSSVTVSTTGTINNLDFSNANVIRMTNASAATITGLKAGTDGQRVIIFALGTGDVDCANASASSSVGNRFSLDATSSSRLRAGLSRIELEYDTTSGVWREVNSYLCDYVSSITNLTATPVSTGYQGASQLTSVLIIAPSGDKATCILTAQGGAGVGWSGTWFGPGTVTAGALTFTMTGSGAEPYTINLDSGGGTISIARNGAGTITGVTTVICRRLM